MSKTVVGWHERVALPDLDINGLFAKIDTGADSSSLHALNITYLKGASEVEFTAPLLRWQKNCTTWLEGGVRRVRTKIVDERIVRSSNAEQERRAVIETKVILGTETFLARFSLTSRTGMRFAVLVGRDALKDRFLVDSTSAHLTDSANVRCDRP